ncbi:MAG: hypothetical protein LCH69_12940 [Proteobacteria bacterium]|nr:hypothetical protein [Pseudomonadota bacterium]
MRKLALVTAGLMVLSGPAFANQCPSLVTKVDEAMATATVDDATKTQITALRDSGNAAHEAGDHAKAEADLGEALKLLGM